MTKPIYEEINIGLGGKIIKRTDANGTESWIPIDPSNSDYQRYLNPEAEQPTPIIEVEFGIGGYDPSKPNNNIIEEIETPDQEIDDATT